MPCSRPFLQRIKSAWASDSDTMVVKVACGKCPSCLKQKQRELAVRLQYDLKSPICYDNIFFTLTYDDEHLEYNVIDKDTGEIFDLMPSVNKETMQKYLKRVRKTLDYNPDKTKLMYYITGEYGAHKRPHYHGVIYLLGEKTNKVSLHDALKKKWLFCQWQELSDEKSFQSALSEAANMYVAKHQVKRCAGTRYQFPYFQLRSKGIGFTFFKYYPKEVQFAINNGFLWINRKRKTPIPRYFAAKLGLNPNYNDLFDLKKYLDNRKNFNENELHKLNKYIAEQYRKQPALTTEQIVDNYFHERCRKLQYEDIYFDKMYTKLSKTSNF